MTKPEQALTHFRTGLNCAQSVLLPYAREAGLTESEALRVAAAFGSGLRIGEVCGAAAGAAMALGLRYGPAEPSDQAAKTDCGMRTSAFMTGFAKECGSILCRDIRTGSHPRKNCERAVTLAAQMLEAAWGTEQHPKKP